MDVKIPKIIMQTWKTQVIPDHWKSSQRAILKHMPIERGWKYVLMTDEDNRNFCAQHFPDFLPYYDALEYNIERADAIRYMFLYVNGGVYMDLDIQIVKPIDDLFYEDKDIYVVRSGNFKDYYTNAFMASKPRVKLWLDCIEAMKQPYAFWQMGKHLKVMGTSGPMMLTSIIRKHKKPKNKTLTLAELPADMITSCTVCDPKPCDIKNGKGYARTLAGSSWCEADSLFYTKVYCNSKKIGFVILILLIILIYSIYRYRQRKRGM